MAKNEQQLITAYHNKGLSNEEIAAKVGVTNEYVRTVCSRKRRARIRSPDSSNSICVYCGKTLDMSGNHRSRLFCDEKCRKKYYNQSEMRTPYICTCVQCGNDFVAYGFPQKRYCSRECQALARKNHE